MSKDLRKRLDITRQEELDMPIADWVGELSPKQRVIIQSKPKWEQRTWRCSPIIALIQQQVIANVGRNAGRAPDNVPIADGKIVGNPSELAKEDDDSDSAESIDGPMGGIFDDDDW